MGQTDTATPRMGDAHPRTPRAIGRTTHVLNVLNVLTVPKRSWIRIGPVANHRLTRLQLPTATLSAGLRTSPSLTTYTRTGRVETAGSSAQGQQVKRRLRYAFARERHELDWNVVKHGPYLCPASSVNQIMAQRIAWTTKVLLDGNRIVP